MPRCCAIISWSDFVSKTVPVVDGHGSSIRSFLKIVPFVVSDSQRTPLYDAGPMIGTDILYICFYFWNNNNNFHTII